MKQFLVYWLWPNPGMWTYGDKKILMAIVLCGILVLLSFTIKFWRSQLQNSVTRSLSNSWSRATFWFGIVGLILIVSRVETIQFLSMRVLWALWFLSFFLYAVFQLIQFRRRHYVLLKRVHVVDERERYLPH